MSNTARPTSILARFANNLSQRWSRPNVVETLVGIDYKGNKYYEMRGANVQERRLEGHVLPKRWYYPSDENQEDWDQYVPPEWEAWLRYRRIDAPTEDEVHLNLAVAYAKQLNAAKIAEEEQRRLQSPEQTSLPVPPDTVTKSVQPVKESVTDEQQNFRYDRETGKNPTKGFPVYEEYENLPTQGAAGDLRIREAQRRNPFID